MNNYDLVVIGAGPGGTPAAQQAAMMGKNVLLIDDRGEPGGECLFDGCIPSKILEESADNFYLSNHMSIFDVEVDGTTKINWANVVKKKDKIVSQRSLAALKNLNKILTFKKGTASFLSDKTILITSTDGNNETVSFEKAVIATGSSPFIPPIKGNGVKNLWTNKEMFDEEDLPESLLVIGGGPIGVEFAQMLSKLGVKCIIVERFNRILGPVDEEFAERIQIKMKKENNIDIYVSTNVLEVNFTDDCFKVKCEKEGQIFTIDADRAIISVGRTATVQNLALEKAGVNFDIKGIAVNEFLQTKNPNIYAVGDVIKGPKFAHVATYEAGIAMHNMFNPKKIAVDFNKVSWVLFSDPEIASAGFNLQEALNLGMDVIEGQYNYNEDARAQINENDTGALKFVVDKKNHRIVGIQIMVEGASGIIGEAALIVSAKLTLEDVASAIHPHPTLTESFGVLAKQMIFSLKK